jgi:UDP-GlcNAc:undecaprenyl-phosphate/decaprenyl-phosphate GlcNAc-1-phosphate transferase
MLLPLLGFLVAGLAAALLLVPLARVLSDRVGLVDRPTPDRWHKRSVGKLGGVAMAAAVALIWPWTGLPATAGPLLLTTGLMFTLGLIDDLRPVRPTTKLIGQVMVVSLLLYLAPPIGITGNVLLDHALAFFWVLGLTNAFNLLDNIDGLSAGIAAIAAGFLTVTVVSADPALQPLALALAAFVGVCVGFLVYNFQPASIFMGDSGSHLVGFFVSAATLTALPHLDARSLVPTVAAPVVTLLIPIFDTAFVTITRGLTGRSIFSGGRDHTSHRLVALGMSERRTVLVLYGLAIVGGAIGLLFHADSARYGWGLAVLYVAVLSSLGLYLGHRDAATADHDVADVSRTLPGELAIRYRTYEVLLDAVLIGVAYYLAFGLRFAEPEFSHFLPYFGQSLPLVLALQLGGLYLSGKYRQVWRGFGTGEAAAILRGVGLGMAATLVAVLYAYRFEGFSRAVFLLDAALLTAGLIATRAALSAVDDFLRRQRAGGRQALIVGAGRGGALAVRELLQNPALGLIPMGFLDDDPSKRRQRVDGYRVVGRVCDIEQILSRSGGSIGAVVIAIRDLPEAALTDVIGACDRAGVPVRRMRFALEDTDWRDRTPGVVRFPGR